VSKRKELIEEILKVKRRQDKITCKFMNLLNRSTAKDLNFILREERIRENNSIVFKYKQQTDYDEMLKEVPAIERFFIADITKQYGLRLLGNVSNGYKSVYELEQDVGIASGHMASSRDEGRLVVILKAHIIKIVEHKEERKPQPQSEFSKNFYHDEFGTMVGKPRNEGYEKQHW